MRGISLASDGIYIRRVSVYQSAYWEEWRNERLDEVANSSRGKVDRAGLLNSIRSGVDCLWIIFDGLTPQAIVITSIEEAPRKKICVLKACVGKHYSKWFHVEKDDLREYARRQGCTAMLAIARPGWERVLKDYEKTHVLLELELE